RARGLPARGGEFYVWARGSGKKPWDKTYLGCSRGWPIFGQPNKPLLQLVIAKTDGRGMVSADARQDQRHQKPIRRDAALPRPSRAPARALLRRWRGCAERLRTAGDGAIPCP